MSSLRSPLSGLVLVVASLLFGANGSMAAIDAPVSPDASPEAHALLRYLESIHGTHILSGQQETVDWFGNDDNTEMDHIFSVTGKVPAIRGYDYLFVSDPRNTMQRIAERATAWARAGGIATIAWHWFMEVDSPNGPAFYTPTAHATQFTNYDIRQAMIAGTPENVEFMTELDLVAEDLKQLRDAGVPVLWRPFHEVGGPWFWWSAHGPEPFKWAWRTMFNRFTHDHGINNLIWVFNPNDLNILTTWDPGATYYDMVSLDVYPTSGHPVYAAEYQHYRDYTGGRKLTALSENGRMPDPDLLGAEKAGWVYFCTWAGDFITGETSNDSAFKQKVYQHERVLTRDELPDVYHFATSPVFTAHPTSVEAAVGDRVELRVQVVSSEAVTLRWFKNDTQLAGESASTLVLNAAQLNDVGRYRVEATNALGSTVSKVATLAVGAMNGRFANLSTRADVRTGLGNLVVGFVLAGTGERQILLRAVGPELVRFGLAETEVLADPRIELRKGNTLEASNDDWNQGAGEVAKVGAALGAFGLTDGSRDAAVLATLGPGLYTVNVVGASDGTGIVVAEMYDAGGIGGNLNMVNLSSRGFVGTGQSVLIPGIVVADAPRRVLVRGVGPALVPLGIAEALPNPVVKIVDQEGNTVYENDDWGSATSSPEMMAAFAATGAFSLPDNSQDAAIVVTLPPGRYTAVVSDRDGRSGVALVEVYQMEP